MPLKVASQFVLSTPSRFQRCGVALLFFCLTGFAAHLANAVQGSLQAVTFIGPVTGQSISFSLYLPPGYNASTNRYPLIIHLHGIGGTHHGAQTNLVPQSLEAAVAAGIIQPCIVAFPDGYGDSFWADSANSSKPAETNVRSEIIPYLDANYRTVAQRNRRAMQGFSMGGFGAGKFAAKFPELFAACVVYDGALLNWTQIQQRHPVQAAEIFNNNAATFDLYSPWYWLTQNASTLRATMPFRDSVGALTNENRAWRDALIAELVTSEYVETSLPHNLGPLLDAQGFDSWAFIAAAFAAADADSNSFRLSISKQGNHAFLQWPPAPGATFQLEHRSALAAGAFWQTLATNLDGSSNTWFVHSNALLMSAGFYRVARSTSNPAPQFVFNWSGTNFTYTDSNRTFTGIMLKPDGTGPFPAVIINHGAGGSVTNYSLQKAREMSPWGLVCIAPNLSHVAGGETNPVNMGFCGENLARISACRNVLSSLGFVDSNRVALFGHSMGAFATIGSASVLGASLRAGAITSGGVIPDVAGTNNAAPTVSEAKVGQIPFLMVHCDADPVVPPIRSELFQLVLNSNSVPNQRIVISSNAIPNSSNWHNIQNDANANALVLTNTRAWFQNFGVLP